jgi:hypothetical protein
MAISNSLAPAITPIKQAVVNQLSDSKKLGKKVAQFAVKAFKEISYYIGVGLACALAVVAVHFALTHPVTAIALVALGAIAYRHSDSIKFSLSIYLHSIKDKLGAKNDKWISKLSDQLYFGGTPLENKGHVKTFKETKVSSILSLTESLESNIKTRYTTPVSPLTWAHVETNFKHLSTLKNEVMSVEKMHQIADHIEEEIKNGKNVYVYDELGEQRASLAMVAYLIKYDKKLTPKQAVDLVKQNRSVACFNLQHLGRIHEFVDSLSPQDPKEEKNKKIFSFF